MLGAINWLLKGPEGGGGLEKSLHTLTFGKGGSNSFLRNICQVDILY